MKKALMTFSLIPECALGARVKELCAMAKSAGFEALDMMDIELKLYGEDRVKAALAESGLTLGCLIANVSFYKNPEKVEAQLLSALAQCKRMGAPMLMVVPGAPTDKKICADYTRQELLDIAVYHYRKAVELGRIYGVQIGFENTPQHFKPLASAPDCLYVLEHVDGLGFIFDTANMKVADPDDDALRYYDAVKPYIVRIHLKDVVVTDKGNAERCADGRWLRPVLTGSGSVRLKELLQRLHADSYDGTLTVEYTASGTKGKGHRVMMKACTNFMDSAMSDSAQPLPPYDRIEGLDKPVSRLFFGTAMKSMLMGGNADALLDSILATGVNAFDCARGYGLAEKSLGGWINRRGVRERIVLLTKCGNVSAGGVHIDRGVIESELETSLKTLQTDYIDIYLLHRDDPKTPVSEIIDTLNDACNAGKIRVFGASNWTHTRIAEANAYAEAHGLRGFSISSPNYGLTVQVQDPWGGECVSISGDENADARAWYADQQMPVLAYSSLGRGFFSGKFRAFDDAGAKKVLDPFSQKGYLYPVNMERLARAEILARRKGCSVAEIAMRYIFANPMRVFAIVSTSNPARMKQNIESVRNPLTAEEADWLEHGNISDKEN